LPIHIQEDSRTPNRPNKNRTSWQQIIIETASTENRERILMPVSEQKQMMYKDKPIKITADFSMET
jgi:hypothetical protein